MTNQLERQCEPINVALNVVCSALYCYQIRLHNEVESRGNAH